MDSRILTPTEISFPPVLHKSKLHTPRVTPQMVRRPRLLNQLEEGKQERIMSVIAPAGFGKSILVGQWLMELDKPAGWITLDAADNNPDFFWSYLAAAVENAFNDSRQPLSACQNTTPLEFCLHAINEVNGYTEDFILALDNFHLIKNPNILTNLEHIIRFAPENLHVLIISRNQLPFSVRRESCTDPKIIRTKDLLFTEDEMMAFCIQNGLQVTPDEISLIHQRTGGWIAALKLSASSSQALSADELLYALRGNTPPLSDYIASEIFKMWPENLRDALLHTSILHVLSESLCEEVYGKSARGKFPEIFESATPFVTPINTGRDGYRFHPLFAEYLQHELLNKHKQFVPELHHSAAVWYEKNGITREAISHYLKAGYSGQALSLLEQEAKEVISDGDELAAFLIYLDTFPSDMVESSPILCLVVAWRMAVDGRVDEAELWLAKSEGSSDLDGVAPQIRHQIKNETALVRAFLLFRQKDVSLALHNLKVICGKMDGESMFKKKGIALNRAEPTLLSGPLGLFGRLKQVARINNVLLNELIRVGLPYGYLTVVRAELLYELNDRDAALEILIQGMADALQGSSLGELIPAFILLAKIRISRGESEEAFQVIGEGEKKANAENKLHWLTILGAFRVRLQIHVGGHESIDDWLQNRAPNLYDKLCVEREYEYITLARALLCRQNYCDAMLILERLLANAQIEDRIPSSIEILNIQALTYQEMGETAKALTTLHQSLALGRVDGYIRSFLDEGAPMASLLQQYARLGPKDELIGYSRLLPYARTLLRQLKADRLSKKMPTQKNHLPRGETGLPIEPLTRRETQVLRLLVQELSNADIAEKLSLTVNTVKVHNRNLFFKLDVKNRTMAVERARELGLR